MPSSMATLLLSLSMCLLSPSLMATPFRQRSARQEEIVGEKRGVGWRYVPYRPLAASLAYKTGRDIIALRTSAHYVFSFSFLSANKNAKMYFGIRI